MSETDRPLNPSPTVLRITMFPFFLVAVGASAGHIVLWTSVLNQLAARNLPGAAYRLLEKGLLLFTALSPFWIGPRWFAETFAVPGGTMQRMTWVTGYVGVCVLVALVELPRRLARRRWASEIDVATSSRIERLRNASGRVPVQGVFTRTLAAIPGNQICELEVNEKRLPVSSLPPALRDLVIVHFSDLHITGRMELAFYERVVEIANRLQPDVVAITGDLIDDARYLDWLPVLGCLRAREGVYFVLGNHDKRVKSLSRIRDRLRDAGLISVGEHIHDTTWRGERVLVGGNEMPWIGPAPEPSTRHDIYALRLALLHTPDQIRWAQQHRFQLALAGHTHGGQVRLPGLGAVLTPSRYGTRYACGVFLEPPTTLHVSRGVSALHPVRFHCRPEITRLVLEPLVA